MIHAKFFDGKSSKERKAEVTIIGRSLVIYDADTKVQTKVELDHLNVGHMNDFVVLSDAEIEIHLSKEDYAKLGHKPSFMGKDKVPIIKSSLIAFSLLLVLYYFYIPLMKLATSFIPDSFIDHTAKQLVAVYQPQHCLSTEQEKSLEEIFARLGKNYSTYKVFVIDSPMVNAFVMPGNLIVIHDELLETSSSPEAIAGIISHEMAHIEGEHIKIGYIKHYLVETFSTFVLNQSAATGIIKQITQGLFTQQEEKNADKIAALNLKDQQISPKGMVDFFKQLQKKDAGYMKYLSYTHPDYPDRIKVFSEVYDTYPVLSEQAWKVLKSGCK